MTERTAIIGGGLGGLAAACTLAARGHRVTLCEANDWAGGKAASLEANGFRFDMGPTILTLPRVLRRVFEEAGRSLDDYVELIPLDPQWRCFYQEGGVLDLHADRQRMLIALADFAPGTVEGYQRFLDWSAQMSEVSDRYFFWKSVGRLRDIFGTSQAFRPGFLRDVWTMKLGTSMAEVVRKHVPEPRVAQMIDHFAQYVGSSPELSPAVLGGIAVMQTDEGIWYPKGGIHAVPNALQRLAVELGVEIRLAASVRRIIHDRGQVRGIEMDCGERIDAERVVSNMDTVRTHRELLNGSVRAFEKRRSFESACSGVVLYLGLSKAYDHLLHHNFVFSCDPHEEFESIYAKGEPAPDPTCYVCAPARSDVTVAPTGGDALYVLVHTPYLREHHDWRNMLRAYRRVILDKLKSTGGMADIEDRIVFESHLTPQDIHDRYRVLNGAIYGLSSHGKWTGAFKPANRSPDINGLYFAGGSAHPGPGMPMALMSGWIAADTLDRDHPTSKRSESHAGN